MSIAFVHVDLSCRHEVNWRGEFGIEWLDVLVPRRKDGTFGAVLCDRCRRKRRITHARWVRADSSQESGRD